MDAQTTLSRVHPGAGSLPTEPCVIVLTDWFGQETDLLKLFDRANSNTTSTNAMRLVLVVANGDLRDEKSRHLIRNLVDAGAFILEPEKSEGSADPHDPFAFAEGQFRTAMQIYQAPVSAVSSAVNTSEPSEPEGYKAFATALTKLPDDALSDLFEGKMRPGWQYEK